MVCPNCGNELSENEAFCGKCGTACPSQVQTVEYIQPNVVGNVQFQQADNAKPKKKTGLIIALVAAIAVIAAFIFLIMPKLGKKSGVKVNGKSYSFASLDDVYEFGKMDGKAFQAGGRNEMFGPNTAGDFIPLAYYKADDWVKSDEAISESDVSCIIGYGNGENAPLGNIKGSAEILKSNSFRFVYGDEYAGRMAAIYSLTEEGQVFDAIAVDMMFVDNYDIMGINKNSSVNDIKNAGFVEGPINNTYVRVYSAKDTNWNSIDKDYETLYTLEPSNAKILQQMAYPGIEYGKELLSVRWSGIITSPISLNDKQRDFSIGANNKKHYDEMLSSFKNKDERYSDDYYESSIKLEMAIAKQLKNLKFGDIDYFVVVAVENNDEEMDRYWGIGVDGTQISYDQNVCHVYVFATPKVFEKIADAWGMNPKPGLF